LILSQKRYKEQDYNCQLHVPWKSLEKWSTTHEIDNTVSTIPFDETVQLNSIDFRFDDEVTCKGRLEG
jgi:hypothetical protein